MRKYFICLMMFIAFFGCIVGATENSETEKLCNNSVSFISEKLKISNNSEIEQNKSEASEPNDNSENEAEQIHSVDIAMASDNNYAYPMLVAMVSSLENRNPQTRINFYCMVSGDFDKSTKEELLYLEKKYPKCKVNIIDMGDQLKDLYIASIKRITTAAYYRLLLPDLVPNLDKIVYLDVDALILKDLSDLFNVNVNECYLAAITNNRNALKWLEKHQDPYKEKFGTNDPYFCSGTLVLNLKDMRRDQLVSKLVEVASKNNLLLHDMDALNWVCHGKINEIPRIYGSKILRDDIAVLEFSGGNKPWKNRPNMPYADLWWSYAKKTRCFEKIKQKFGYKEALNEDKNKKSEKEANQNNKLENNTPKAA